MDSLVSSRVSSDHLSIFSTASQNWPPFVGKKPIPMYPMRPQASNPVFHPVSGPAPLPSLEISAATASSIINAIDEYQHSMSLRNLSKDLCQPPSAADIGETIDNLTRLFRSLLQIIPEDQQGQNQPLYSLLSHLSRTIINLTNVDPPKQKHAPYPPQKLMIYADAIRHTDMKLKLFKDKVWGHTFPPSQKQQTELDDLLNSLTTAVPSVGSSQTGSSSASVANDSLVNQNQALPMDVGLISYPEVFSDTTSSSTTYGSHVTDPVESPSTLNFAQPNTELIENITSAPTACSGNVVTANTSDEGIRKQTPKRPQLAQTRQGSSSRQTFALAAAHVAMGNLPNSILNWRRPKDSTKLPREREN